MNGISVTVNLDAAGTTVSGRVATGEAVTGSFSGWLELIQMLERLLSEAQR
jgi:hypothetical protein